eukprot:13097_1
MVSRFTPPSNYSSVEYWDTRFSDEEAYDWLCDFSMVESELTKWLPSKGEDEANETRKKNEILVIGCGNSSLSADLQQSGWTNITSLDFSEKVIGRMKEKHPSMHWEIGDMTQLQSAFKGREGTFSAIVDKAAMDALVHDEGDPWNVDVKVVKRVNNMLEGVSRLLAPGGVYIQITFQQLHFRLRYLTGELLTNDCCNRNGQKCTPSNGCPYGWEVSKGVTIPGFALPVFVVVCTRREATT